MIMTVGDAYSIAPGRQAWVVGDKKYVTYEFNNSGKHYAFDQVVKNSLVVLIGSSATLEAPFTSR